MTTTPILRITFLGHSCFILENQGFRVLLDPYAGVRGLRDIQAEAEAVYCSHDHFDHAYLDKVTLRKDVGSPFRVREIPTFHDSEGGALRGQNTVRCFTAQGLTAVHLGDLGHLLTQEQAEAIGPCDALLIPVGGVYTLNPRDAMEVVRQLRPRVVIPMHCRRGETGFEELAPLEDFIALFPPEEVQDYPGNTLLLTKDTPKQTGVLRL